MRKMRCYPITNGAFASHCVNLRINFAKNRLKTLQNAHVNQNETIIGLLRFCQISTCWHPKCGAQSSDHLTPIRNRCKSSSTRLLRNAQRSKIAPWPYPFTAAQASSRSARALITAGLSAMSVNQRSTFGNSDSCTFCHAWREIHGQMFISTML